jgi:PAS domain S-box-containing protein
MDGMVGSHDSFLVVLAVMIAVAASYTALDLGARISAAESRLGALAWLVTAAVCMGGGIWAMHFVAMLAYALPDMQVAYDPWLTAISLLTAIVVTGVGFALVVREGSGHTALIFAGLFMGSGILAMHYLGMAAMRMQAALVYDIAWVVISVLIAVGASIAALWLAFRRAGFLQKSLSALAMGLAISGMHFAGMRAASFHMHDGVDGMQPVAGSVDQGNLALAVSAIAFLILLAAIIAAMFDRRFAALATREAMALKRSEEQFRSLYRRTPLPLHALDAEGRIEEISDAWLALLGYEREAVIGRPLINFMTEESARQRLQDWKTLLSTGELREREYRLVTRDGEFIDVLSTSKVERDDDGNFVRAIGGLVDVTARRRAEEALLQAQKMEAIGQLTGGVAHDFNNILAVILGNLEMLRKRVGDDERILRFADNAMEGARKGASLTQRMLSFARKQHLSSEAVDVGALVEGMRDLLDRSLGPRVSLVFQFPQSLPAVNADPHQLEMALLNLAVNARDAMDQGTIAFTALESKQPPPPLEAGHYVCISVSDDGQGMDEETLARAREPFFTTKGVGRGTGLGLSMANGFAEQSGGTLVISSQKGAGTTIEVWLPVAAAAPSQLVGTEPGPVAVDHSRTLNGRTVMVVDDEILILLGTEAILQDQGVNVIAASTAMEALELYNRHPEIACLLTDYAMPGMTGAQLAAALRVRNPALPIVIATGYAEVPEEIAGYRTLQKPYSVDLLVNTIAAAIVERELQA